jgi:hypothetical protein
MSNDNEAGFFITYSGADVAWAKWINWHLRKEGFFTIMQRYDFNAGSNFINEMYEASKDYSILVVLPSQHSDSPLCVNQWDAAFKKQYYERERELILVRTNACKVEGTRGPLTCIDRVGLDRIEAATRLLEGVRETEYPIEKSSCSVTLTTPSPGFPSVFPDIWNIPHRRNCHFTGRDEIIEQLHESLGSSGSVALTQAIGGLGGVGKTQLALEYAYRYKSDYSCIWWIRSENRTVLAIDYTGCNRSGGGTRFWSHRGSRGDFLDHFDHLAEGIDKKGKMCCNGKNAGRGDTYCAVGARASGQG